MPSLSTGGGVCSQANLLRREPSSLSRGPVAVLLREEEEEEEVVFTRRSEVFTRENREGSAQHRGDYLLFPYSPGHVFFQDLALSCASRAVGKMAKSEADF